MSNWTEADVARVNASRTPIRPARMPQVERSDVPTGKVPRSKYGAVKTTVDGIRFDSKRESERYQELKVMLLSGLIRRLVIQPAFQLLTARPDGVLVQSGRYKADFSFDERVPSENMSEVRWHFRVEDVKGRPTDSYRHRKRIVEAQFGIVIQEIR